MEAHTLGRRVALSFDNGPTEGVTEGVLDTLAHHGVTAMFFPVAQRIDSTWARGVLRRTRDEGHLVGNHSLTHRAPMGRLGVEETLREISGAQAVLGELASPEKMVRPWGTEGVLSRDCLNRAGVELMRREGYTCVMWNSVPRDWAEPDGWVRTALADVKRNDETLVVLHDLPTGAMRALDRFIDELRRLEVAIEPTPPVSCVPIRQGQVRADLTPWCADCACG